ncbi:DUF2812 domain-containing protein [Streptococcus ruminantium]|uniref:DUF2812 domain-containing protein n=1 Tax=Streptococcus ruminantium TaxID=1917441 RepID=UPI0012DE6E26|nr:DUF2812 domain-containing protein [Streptococcus ruminantium]BDD41936.1 hypothetical protein GUT189_02690 [Streptococcus ruminantium]
METKKEICFFFLPDFEKEERYLAEQHLQGWKLIQNKFGLLFIFEKCQPEHVVYRLDFKPKTQDNLEYLQLFKDYGWEYVGRCNHFSCFRKSKVLGEIELYSDRQSKFEMIGKIIGRQFLMALSLLILFTFLFYFLDMPAAIIGMATLAIPVLLYCLVGLLRLRQKYEEVG